MRLGKVHDIDVVADAGAVGRVVVVAEDGQLLADAHCRLRDVGDEVVGHAVGQFADERRGMGTDRIEVSQDDALDGCAAMDEVVDDLLVDLLGVAIGRGGLLVGCVLGDGQVLGVGLSIDRAAAGEDDAP